MITLPLKKKLKILTKVKVSVMLLVLLREASFEDREIDGKLGGKSSCEVFACANFYLIRYAGTPIALMTPEFCFSSN